MTTPDRVRRVKDQRVLSPGAAVWVLRAAAVVFVVATVDAALDPAAALDAWLVVASFAVLIGMGEYYRFGIEDGRQLAPMTLATGLAFALTSRAWQTDLTDLGPGPIIMVSALAMTAGALLHVVRRRTVRSEEVAARFLAICVTAIIFRWTPVWSGRTLLDVDEDWVGGRWPVALFLAAVAAVGLFTFLAISALVVAARSATSFRQALLDEVRSSAGLSLALIATGALIALL